MNPIKLRLKELRKREGLTTKEFAKRIGVSPGNVGDWESEARSSVPGANALMAIAETFGISLDWLVLGKEDDTNENVREVVFRPGQLSSLEEFVLSSKNEDLRRLMEAAILLQRSDLILLHDLALRLNEGGLQSNGLLERAN